MRTPSEYIAAAKARLRDSLMSDCSEVMRHGEHVATVTRVGSPSIGDDPLTGDDPAENCRVLAMASDFPALARGEAVELGRTFRVVTSCHEDIAKVGLVVGLSDDFEKCPCAYGGTRREDGRVRTLEFPLGVLLLETGADASYADGIAPAVEKTYTVAIRHGEWPETSDPEMSDTVEAYPASIPTRHVRLVVSTVTRHDGWFILKCRTRGGAR